MLPLLLWLALLLPGRVPDPAALHHPGYDPTHQGLDVQSWLRRTPEGKPDLARTALDIRHNALLRGAGAGLGWSLLLLAFARRRGWARTPWRAEGLPGSAMHNGTKAIHLGAWAGAMGLGMAILNGVGESLEPGQSRLPQTFLLAGEGLCLVGAAGVWARRLSKNRSWRAVHVVRRTFDALLASATPEATPAATPPDFPDGFDAPLLERRVVVAWDSFQTALRARLPHVVATWSTPGLEALLATRAQALGALGRSDRREGASLLSARVVHLHEDSSWAAATLRVSLRGPALLLARRAGAGRSGTTEWAEMWTFLRRGSLQVPPRGWMEHVCPRCEAPQDPTLNPLASCEVCGTPSGWGEHDWTLSGMVPESEWARPDPLRLDRLAPLVRQDPEATFRQIEDQALGWFARKVRARNTAVAATAATTPRSDVPPAEDDLVVPLVLAVDAMTSEISATESVVWVAISWLAELPTTDPEVDRSRRTLLRMARPTTGALDLTHPESTTPRDWTILDVSGDDLDAHAPATPLPAPA